MLHTCFTIARQITKWQVDRKQIEPLSLRVFTMAERQFWHIVSPSILKTSWFKPTFRVDVIYKTYPNPPGRCYIWRRGLFFFELTVPLVERKLSAEIVIGKEVLHWRNKFYPYCLHPVAVFYFACIAVWKRMASYRTNAGGGKVFRKMLVR